MGIAREGYPLIFSAVVLAVVAFALGWNWLGLSLGLLTAAFLGFFRDPERVPPPGDDSILSPADGRVVGIGPVDKGGVFDDAGIAVSIFLSPLDVHVNRAPVNGKVEEVRYRKGHFFAAYKEVASRRNEQNAMRIADAKGRRVGVIQIAGVLARRIVCYVKAGDSLARGQRVGMIMFGSRVDAFLPAGSRVEVAEGERVKGGETVIGRFS